MENHYLASFDVVSQWLAQELHRVCFANVFELIHWERSQDFYRILFYRNVFLNLSKSYLNIRLQLLANKGKIYSVLFRWQ